MEKSKRHPLFLRRNNRLPVLFLILATIAFGISEIAAQNGQLSVPAERVRLEPEKNAVENGKTPNENLIQKLPTDLGGILLGSDNLINAMSYAFSTQTEVVLEDMSSGTTQIIGPGTDDTNSILSNIGFDFWFDGVRFTQFGANGNGFIRLGLAPTGSSFTNSIGTTTNAPKIMPFWDDLCVGTSGKVHFKTIGSAPNRKLVVEFQNMQITRGAGCAGAGGGTFQLWLFESAGATSPGVIQFVYGAGMTGSNDGGYSIGLQSGAATNFASVSTAADTVSYAAADNVQTGAIAAGKSYLFTPIAPASPSGLNFTAVQPTSLTVNWTDISFGEIGYVIYRSTDGTNYTFLTQTAADATSFNDTGLNPSTNYFYRVYGVSEGVLSSPALEGSQMTAPPGNDTCAAAGGDWSNTATWTDGSVPTGSDNVTIGAGCAVTVDVTNAAALNLTIDNGGTLQSPLAGAVTNNNLTVSGNVTNNGVLDFSTNGDTSGAILTFGAGNNNVTFGGTGATTDIRAMTVAKGAQSTTVELMTTNFTVRGVDTDVAGYLTLTSGTFKISGTFTLTNRTFTGATYTIPAAGGLWLNNPNYTVAPTASSTTTSNSGLFRLTQGTYNVGVTGADGFGGGAGATFIFEGGTFNSPRFDPQSAVSFTMTDGTINIGGAAANTRTNFAAFELFSTTSSFNMSGGTINLIQATVAATPIDWQVRSATFVHTGGVVNVGTAATATNFNFRFRASAPSVVVDNTGGAKTLTATAQTLFFGNVTVNTGATFNINGFLVALFGPFPTSFVNDGAVLGNTAGSRLYLNSANQIAVSGSGTFGTGGSPLQSVDFDAAGGVVLNQTNQIITLRTILFTGDVTNSNKITLGDGGTATGVVQIGNTTTPTDAGVFDAPFDFNVGTGGQILIYLRVVDPRSTGLEINPSRTLTNLTYDDNAVDRSLSLTGGDLTVSSALTLTNGIIATADNILEHNGAAARTNGYVNGNLRRFFTVSGAYTYHVGQNGYSPLAATITSLSPPLGGSTGSLLVRANDMTLAGLDTATSVSRNWFLTESGNLTADLAFTYRDEDVSGSEADYRVFKLDGGALTNECSGGPCVDEMTNTATVTGVTGFSSWGIGENGAGMAGTLEFSGPTYSVSEDGVTATITVNRSGGSGGGVTVDYATVAGGDATGGASCAAGIDYINAGDTLNFASGEMSKTFDVTICNDGDVEPDETVNLALSNATGGAAIGMQNTAVLTITDDDTVSGLEGTFTVGTGGDYPSLTNAGGIFEAMNTLGVTGAVTINIISDLTGETGTHPINEIPGGFSVLIQPAGAPPVTGPTNRLITGSSTVAIIRLNGADNVTIDGSFNGGGSAGDIVGGDASIRNLTVQNTNTTAATNEAVIFLQTGTNGAQNNTIKNVNVLGQDPIETLIGIAIGGNTIGTSGADNDNNRVENCSFRRAFIGVYNAGTSAANQNAGNVITKNDLTGTGPERLRRAGMLFFNHDGLEVSLNSIGGIDTNEGIDAYGIGVGTQAVSTTTVTSGAITNSVITRNKVAGITSSSTTGFSAFGIGIAGGSTGANTISNNMVSGVIAPSTSPDLVAGIFIVGAVGSDTRLYHNSVSLTGDRGAVANQIGSYGIAITGADPSVELKNNIFSNTQTSGGGANARTYAIGMVSTAFTNFNSNFNDFFASGTNASFFRTGSLASTGGTMYPNLAAFSAATSSDADSQEVDPLFVDAAADLHIQPTSPVTDDGTPLKIVSIDFDGEARSASTPDIGADEVKTVAAPGTLQFSNATYSGGEGSSPFTVTVTRTGGSDGEVSVDYATSDGAATGGAACTAGVDYIDTSGTLTFGDGVTSQTFDVVVCDDMTNEPDETINYTLTNPTGGATLGTPDSAVQTIVDNDKAPLLGSLTIDDVRVTEGDAGMFNAQFTVTLTAPDAVVGPVPVAEVDYSTADGTATAGSDYVMTGGSLTFSSPGTMTINVPVSGDTLKEANETFLVNLSNPLNATIADGQGVGIIVDKDRAYVGDFDNDKKTDYSVYRPSTNVWYVLQSTNGIPKIDTFGSAGDIAVPGDYDGDGITDRALYRPSEGNWYITQSQGKILTVQNWGLADDKPVQGDYDGDGKTDIAVYRPSDGQWYLLQSMDGPAVIQFGIETDTPVTGDFDGDAVNDLAIYRDGVWYILRSSDSAVTILNWGLSTDLPVSGDFDGDGRTDLGIYRDGIWWILQSLSGDPLVISFGLTTDIPAVGDFDGDGTSDFAVFRPSDGDWYVLQSSDFAVTGVHWGVDGDVPIPAAYTP
jgi:hypothetical protein